MYIYWKLTGFNNVQRWVYVDRTFNIYRLSGSDLELARLVRDIYTITILAYDTMGIINLKD